MTEQSAEQQRRAGNAQSRERQRKYADLIGEGKSRRTAEQRQTARSQRR